MMTRSGGRAADNAALYALLRDDLGARSPPAARAHDWDYLLRAANLHGVTPLLAPRLRALPDVPDAVQAAIQTAYWRNHFRNRTLLDALRQVLRAADARGIAVIPLKGALLATRYYPDPALRPMSDLDLMVRAADLPALADLLRACGYASAPVQPALVAAAHQNPLFAEHRCVGTRDGVPILIEYRAEPLAPVRLDFAALDTPLASALARHIEGMWARSGPGQIAGIPITRLAPEDLTLHVASHLAIRHASFRLLWLYDLVRILDDANGAFDWHRLADSARALRLDAPVFAALAAAHDRLGAPVPLREIAPLFAARGHGPQRVVAVAERRAFARARAALIGGDLTTRRIFFSGEIVVSLARLRGIAPLLRATRWMLAPARDYMRVWSRDIIGREQPYRRALASRAVFGWWRAIMVMRVRVPLPALARVVDRIARIPPLRDFSQTAALRDEIETLTRWR